MKEPESETIRSLRRADFKIAVLLLGACGLLVWETLSYPMTGTFGGVDSRWYVSPALFPLVTLFVIIVTSALLLLRATREAGFQQFANLQSWIGDWRQTVNQDRWYVILTLCLYIYLLIPSVDFFLATASFLYALTFRFYVQVPALRRWATQASLLSLLLLLGLRLFDAESFYLLSQESTLNEPQIMHGDIFIGLLLVVSTCKLLQATPGQATVRWHVLLTALLVPLFLMFAFNFLLQVPMPVEYGSVIKGMEYIWYDLLNL